ncbi:hypothetical protein B1H10_04940 [candidate division KSB1 bacterium 4484_188]|nr:MAG: hypothetical protein B1H10_04940 [candidate division KSB1 bacterium 4484_188]HFE63216.1 CPBP family intramembrane metalloprotease [Caldithrix sp.]
MNPDQEKKFPKPVEAFIVIILSFIFVIGITQLLMILFLPDADDASKNAIGQKIFSTIGELGLLIIPLVYIRSRDLKSRSVFRLNPIPFPIILWSFIAGLGISIMADELDRLITLLFPAPEFIAEIAEALRIQSVTDFLFLFTGMVIIAPITEEFLIRGFLQKSLEEHQDVTRAVIYASLAWAIIHFVPIWAIQIFIMGIVLGLLTWKSESILPAIIGHATNNALALLFNNIDVENILRFYLWGSHVSPLVLLLSLAGVVLSVRKFYDYYPNVTRGKPPTS